MADSKASLGKSVSTRFLLLCFGISLASVVPVLWFASNEAEQILVEDFTGRLERRRANLEDHYENGGLLLLREKIRDRIDRGLIDKGAILLVDANGNKIEGNLANWPDNVSHEAGWHSVDLHRDGEVGAHAYMVAVTQLPNGYRFMVSGLLDDRDDMRSSLWHAMLGALLLAVLLALAGSLFIRRHLDRMVDTVARTANNIADGNLSQRSPRNYSDDPLDRISASLNRMLERIESLIEENRTLTDALAHDLRSPLTRISANLDRSSQLASADDCAASLPAIEEEVALMLRMIDDTLEISRAEAGIGRENFASTDLSSVIGSLYEMYLPLAEANGVEITLSCEEPLLVDCNKGLVTRAIANLIDNAFKHAISGKSITIGCRTTATEAIITVADRGEGIPVSQYAAAMQKFRRLSAARTLPGMGVGLALVAAIAKLHNGELRFDDNKPGLVASLVLAKAPVDEASVDLDMTVTA